jgi:ABC-type phosphate/phosphonate transport system substrate-binding protein
MRKSDEASANRGRRSLCGAIGAAALLGTAAVHAQGAAKPKTGISKSGWRLLINEAVTGETNFFLLTARYRPLADYVTERLKGKTAIDVEPVVDIKRFVTLAQGQPKPELVFGKSVNQLAKLVRDQNYQPIVRRADPYKAAFIVAKDSPLKSLADAGKAKIKIIMPDEYAATTAVARAELRVQNVTMAEIVHTKYQEAVAQQIKTGFGQIGVVNPTTARKWAEDGGRVLAETQPVVNWSVLASPSLSAVDVAQVREAFLGMNTQGATVLSGLGVKSWAAAERTEYLALLDYTKE